MSRIAQKLCDEIVDPAIKPSGESNSKSRSRHYNQCCDEIVDPVIKPSGESNSTSRSRHYSQCFSNLSSQCSSKRPRSIIIDKKVTNKICPNEHKPSKTKLKEPLIKKNYNSKAANTDITGSFLCDTDCLTRVQKRSHKCTCKCSQNHSSTKTIPKTIQTLNNVKYILQTDKACTNSVKTYSCGTQFSDRFSEGATKSNINANRRSNLESMPRDSRPTFHDIMGARRWALSQHRTQGPDF